jgi:hypothetical protein
MAAMCVDPMSILDGMAPHVWHGPTATQDRYKGVLVDGQHLNAKNYHVTLGKALHAHPLLARWTRNRPPLHLH